jgi:hypothetical protein
VPERITLDRVDVAAGMLPKGLHIAPRQSIRNTAHVMAGRLAASRRIRSLACKPRAGWGIRKSLMPGLREFSLFRFIL